MSCHKLLLAMNHCLFIVINCCFHCGLSQPLIHSTTLMPHVREDILKARSQHEFIVNEMEMLSESEMVRYSSDSDRSSISLTSSQLSNAIAVHGARKNLTILDAIDTLKESLDFRRNEIPEISQSEDSETETVIGSERTELSSQNSNTVSEVEKRTQGRLDELIDLITSDSPHEISQTDPADTSGDSLSSSQNSNTLSELAAHNEAYIQRVADNERSVTELLDANTLRGTNKLRRSKIPRWNKVPEISRQQDNQGDDDNDSDTKTVTGSEEGMTIISVAGHITFDITN